MMEYSAYALSALLVVLYVRALINDTRRETKRMTELDCVGVVWRHAQAAFAKGDGAVGRALMDAGRDMYPENRE